MKNSEHYAKKIRQLVKEKSAGVSAPQVDDKIELIIRGILEENVDPRKVPAALSAIEKEYVDFNELRVSPVRDIIDVVGENYPEIRSKAQSIVNTLQVIFDRANNLSLDFLDNKPKREIRRILREKLGLGRYAESFVTLYGFDGHAMPVDNLLLDALKLGEYIHPSSDLDDLQGFLERITPHADAITYHQALRKYVSEMARKVSRLWEKQRKEMEAAEREQKAAAEEEKTEEEKTEEKSEAEEPTAVHESKEGKTSKKKSKKRAKGSKKSTRAKKTESARRKKSSSTKAKVKSARSTTKASKIKAPKAKSDSSNHSKQ